MKVIKGFAVGIFSFLLFIAILLFGFLFTVNSTVMNPNYLSKRIDSIDMTELVNEIVTNDSSQDTQEVINTLKDIVPKVEPEIKTRLKMVVNSTYDYLLGKRADPEIRATLGDSFLNAQFVQDILDKISLPELIDAATASNQGGDQIPEEFMTAIKEVVADMEPQIKEQAANIVDPVFAYILGQTQSLDMMQVLRSTVLNEEFIVPLIDSLDLSSIAQELITGQIIDQIPPDLAFLTDHVGSAVKAIEPTIKQEFKKAAGPFLDYLTGATNTLSIYVSLDQVTSALETNLKEELLTNPPAELAGLSQSQLEQLFDSSFFASISDFLPSTVEIDESVLGPDAVASFKGTISDLEQSITDVRISVNDAISEAEDPLSTARQVVSYFKLAYWLMLAFIALMIIGIILVLRNVKSITLSVGIPPLIYGIIVYAGVWAARIYSDGTIPFTTDLPGNAESLIFDTATSVIRPLEIYSLSMLILGLVLILVSVFYNRFKTERPAVDVEVVEPEEPNAIDESDEENNEIP